MTKHDMTGFFQVDPLKFTQAPLRAERTVSLNASPDKVWALISDHEKLPTYLSFVQKVTVDNANATTANGVGAVRTCSIGDIALIEDIRLSEANRALAGLLRPPGCRHDDRPGSGRAPAGHQWAHRNIRRGRSYVKPRLDSSRLYNSPWVETN